MTLQAPSGRTAVTFSDPSFAAISGFDEPVYALAWSTHRYQNKAGDWECVLPVDNGLIDGVPAHRYLRRGCHLTFTQENNNPLGDPGNEYLMYEGVVQQRNHLSADGSTYLRLAGGLRNLLLSDRSTFYGLTYSGMAANTVAADLVDGNNIIGPNGGILTPGTGILPKMTFKNQSRLAALLKVGEQARWAFRESWDHDRPEFTLIDNPPDSNVVLAKVPYYDPLVHDGFGAAGSGIIADPPSFRYDGQNIVNRIIPIGADEPEGDLTLEFSTLSQPYPILSALAPDGSTYYYIEDEDSIDRYGLVETHLVRTDVKNPSDDAGTRAAAANVLYYVAVGQLLKRKSEIIIVDMPVANGAEIWALPGDKIRLVYTGQVQTAGGAVDWIDTDRFFMVSERHDESDVSGVRRVRFVLQAPDVEMTIPDLPDAIILPPQDTDPYPSPDPSDDDFPESVDCCDDPDTDIEPPESPDPPLPPVITSTPPPTDPPPIEPPPEPLGRVISFAQGPTQNSISDVEGFGTVQAEETFFENTFGVGCYDGSSWLGTNLETWGQSNAVNSGLMVTGNADLAAGDRIFLGVYSNRTGATTATPTLTFSNPGYTYELVSSLTYPDQDEETDEVRIDVFEIVSVDEGELLSDTEIEIDWVDTQSEMAALAMTFRLPAPTAAVGKNGAAATTVEVTLPSPFAALSHTWTFLTANPNGAVAVVV